MWHRNETIKQDGEVIPGHEFPIRQIKQLGDFQDVDRTALLLCEKSGDLSGLSDIVTGNRHLNPTPNEERRVNIQVCTTTMKSAQEPLRVIGSRQRYMLRNRHTFKV
jgi:hypothetical protein